MPQRSVAHATRDASSPKRKKAARDAAANWREQERSVGISLIKRRTLMAQIKRPLTRREEEDQIKAFIARKGVLRLELREDGSVKERRIKAAPARASTPRA